MADKASSRPTNQPASVQPGTPASAPSIKGGLAGIESIVDPRFAALVRAGVDAATLRTWDPGLSRRSRLLVPVDVQAYVVAAGGAEPIVPLTGGAGDPAPFSAGSPLPVGVHLHWAMPDALLAARKVSSVDRLTLPPLPDRWVVMRTMQPIGARRVEAHGWVIDAAAGSVTPLESYSGSSSPAPAARPRLDGASGGSLLWTASYTASAGRFALHDPLTDLRGGDGAVPTGRWHADQAVYTVAGWWSDLGEDPVSGVRGPAALDARLTELRWFDGHDSVLDESNEDDEDDPVLPAPAAPRPSTKEELRILSETLVGADIGQGVVGVTPKEVVFTSVLPQHATLLHGSVLGVPVAGRVPAADDRPDPADLGVAVGHDLDDVVAALGARVLGLSAAQRQSAETLVAAFTSGLIERLGSPDGLEDLAEREHGDTFWALPGAPLPGAHSDRLRAQDSAPIGPTTVGRKGRAAHAADALGGTKLGWSGGPSPAPRPVRTVTGGAPRDIARTAPRYFRPQAPMVALRGARPNHRHHGDGWYDEDGRLRCRYPAHCVTEISGVVTGASVLATLGSGAIPAEVILVVREAVLLNPYGHQWLAVAAAPAPSDRSALEARLAAEMVRLYGVDGRYDGSSHLATSIPLRDGRAEWADVSADQSIVDRQIAAELARHSLVAGAPPSPVGFTTWRQPWVPLWLEWRVRVEGTDTAAGWELDGLDLRPAAGGPAGNPVASTLVGRSPIGNSVATALHYGISRWLDAERQRDATGGSTLPPTDTSILERLGDLLGPASGVPTALDLVSASLDGIREQLLGIDYVGVIERAAGARPQAVGAPTPVFGGVLRIDALRLVDAFGRVLDVPPGAVAGTASTADLAVAAPAGGTGIALAGMHPGIWMRPRVQHQARWLLRLVDPAPTGSIEPREAFVDQIDPARAVNPVAGFLLPDHIDEELEAFTGAGVAIGQVAHDAVSGAVTWEPAPGRAVPPDARPEADLEPAARILAEIAAGLLAADAQARTQDRPASDSSLAAMLRAIDTTLWSVDTFSAIGSPTVAGLVGRPVAVVRATLRLDTPDDLDEVDVVSPGGAAQRRAAFAAMAEQRFAVRLGALTRTDDALLGFFVDDDYAHLHLVDRVISEYAIEGGRHRGHFGLLGAVQTPASRPLDHPYLVPDPTIWVRPGQTVRLTLLMLPAGRVHLTSGILPRKQIALADDWVTPGLRRLVPSVRVGPVLVDPAEIRLPRVSLLGDAQTFTRRTGPLTWRDDPILAATQSAYLPRLPHEVQEGWVRVTPDGPDGVA